MGHECCEINYQSDLLVMVHHDLTGMLVLTSRFYPSFTTDSGMYRNQGIGPPNIIVGRPMRNLLNIQP